MKTEEIKLAFETNVQFALVDEINKVANEARASLDKSYQLYKSFEDEKKISSKKIDEVESLISKAINIENQLGTQSNEVSKLKILLNVLKGRYKENK